MSEKLAISLPYPLLARVETFRKRSGESRSGVIQRAIRVFLEGHARKTKIGRYLEGYRKMPETAGEIRAAEAAARYLLALEPWK
ncbi:MAG: hypothetical protein V1495_02840 [Pseudomonadota bacterium]